MSGWPPPPATLTGWAGPPRPRIENWHVARSALLKEERTSPRRTETAFTHRTGTAGGLRPRRSSAVAGRATARCSLGRRTRNSGPCRLGTRQNSSAGVQVEGVARVDPQPPARRQEHHLTSVLSAANKRTCRPSPATVARGASAVELVRLEMPDLGQQVRAQAAVDGRGPADEVRAMAAQPSGGEVLDQEPLTRAHLRRVRTEGNPSFVG